MTTNPRFIHFLQTQTLQQLTRSTDIYEKGPKLPKNIPTARNFAEKDPQIHDDQPTTPQF